MICSNCRSHVSGDSGILADALCTEVRFVDGNIILRGRMRKSRLVPQIRGILAEHVLPHNDEHVDDRLGKTAEE